MSNPVVLGMLGIEPFKSLFFGGEYGDGGGDDGDDNDFMLILAAVCVIALVLIVLGGIALLSS